MKRYVFWLVAALLFIGLLYVRSTTDIITLNFSPNAPHDGELTLQGKMERGGGIEASGSLRFQGELKVEKPLELRGTLKTDGTIASLSGRAMTGGYDYGFWSIIPPVLAIVLAFTTRQVILALFSGIIAGGIVSGQFNIITNFLMPTIGSLKFAQILLIYLWCLGGLIGIWTKTGGAERFARWAAGHIVRGPRSAKLFAYFMGLVFHQGGTISTILAGTTVRPICDEEKISHEELSYIIDSTASPVATLIPFNIWPTFTGALVIGTAGFLTNIDQAVSFYFAAIPFNFYAIVAILFTLGTSLEVMPWYGKRMRVAMKRSRETGQLDSDEATPLTSKELTNVEVAEGYRSGIEDFLVPLLTLIGIAVSGIFTTGSPAVNEAFFAALLSAMLLAAIKGMPVRKIIDGFVDGVKGVTIGAIILCLAVTLGDVSQYLGTANFVVNTLGDFLPALILPASFLAVCMFISFSTGSSLGTYAVVLPLAMPLAVEVATRASLGNPEYFITLCFAAVIGGSVYGDNCSPISDTTILSSVATGADLMDHAYSQLPMATAAAAIAAVLYTVCATFAF